MQTNEEILTSFMQQNYSDERLAWLLAHAKEGRLSYHSCCCFIGIVTSNHTLKGDRLDCPEAYECHIDKARELIGAREAEFAYFGLAYCCDWRHPPSRKKADEERRAKLIPLVEAEIARREALKQQENTPKDALVEVLA